MCRACIETPVVYPLTPHISGYQSYRTTKAGGAELFREGSVIDLSGQMTMLPFPTLRDWFRLLQLMQSWYAGLVQLMELPLSTWRFKKHGDFCFGKPKSEPAMRS